MEQQNCFIHYLQELEQTVTGFSEIRDLRRQIDSGINARINVSELQDRLITLARMHLKAFLCLKAETKWLHAIPWLQTSEWAKSDQKCAIACMKALKEGASVKDAEKILARGY